MSSEFVEIQVTCGSQDEARSIADTLVEGHLAACVQRLPISSTYRWEGTVERDDEILLLIKTSARRVPEVETVVHEMHSYDVPAFTVVEIGSGSDGYLAWLRAETA